MPNHKENQVNSNNERESINHINGEKRRTWCDEHAKAFFANKKTTKRYLTEYYAPEANISDWLVFSEDELVEYREYMRKEREQFMIANPNEADNEELWNEWMRDAWLESEFIIEGLHPNGAELRYIDLEHPRSTYLFMTYCFSYDKEEQYERRKRWIDLTDAQYISLLSDYLYSSINATVGAIYFHHPDIYKAIAEQCFLQGEDCAILLAEVKEDAESILKEYGDSQPSLLE